MQKTWMRVIADIVAGIAVVTLPWYVSMVLIVVLIVYYPLYIEALFLAFLFDILYARQLTFPYTALSLAAILVLAVSFIRPRIRR